MDGQNGPQMIPKPLRILFFGLPGAMAEETLRGLMSRQAAIAAVVVPQTTVPQLLPASPSPLEPIPAPATLELPLSGARSSMPTLSQLAWDEDVPLLAIGDLRQPEIANALVHELRQIAPDVAVVACFSQRIPAALLAVPRLGFLNLHPSLLPAYRGPAPLFWQFYDGVDSFGVTIHFMDEGLDTGSIAAQTAVHVPDGYTGPETDRLLAETGVSLLTGVLDEMARGTLEVQPQTGPVSHAGWPQEEAFDIPASWSARRAFNFIQGTGEWNHPYRVLTPAGPIVVTSVKGFELETNLAAPYQRDGSDLRIQFNPGVLMAKGGPEASP